MGDFSPHCKDIQNLLRLLEKSCLLGFFFFLNISLLELVIYYLSSRSLGCFCIFKYISIVETHRLPCGSYWLTLTTFYIYITFYIFFFVFFNVAVIKKKLNPSL